MSRTEINVQEVQNAKHTLNSAKACVSAGKNIFNNASSSVSSRIKNRNGISRRIASVQSRMNEIERRIAKIAAVTEYGVSGYLNAENSVRAMGRQVKGVSSPKGVRSIGWSCYFDEKPANVKDLCHRLLYDPNAGNYELSALIRNLDKQLSELDPGVRETLIAFTKALKEGESNRERLLGIGSEVAGVDLGSHIWSNVGDEKNHTFSLIDAHYRETYLRFLEAVLERADQKGTLAASLVNIGIGSTVFSVLGLQASGEYKSIFGKASLEAYLLKFKSEHVEFMAGHGKVEGELGWSGLSGKGKFKKANKKIDKKLEDSGKGFKEKEEFYLDKDGKEIDEKKSPKFYDRDMTIAEAKVSASSSVEVLKGNAKLGEKGTVDVEIGSAEAHAELSGGFYVIGDDGEKKFSPGVKAEIGASATALELEWEQQWLGNEMLGLNTDVQATVGNTEAKADATVQIFSDDGKLDVQLGAGASAELIGGELEGSVGINVLGGEVGVKGSVNYGIGAHADVGYRDGVFKCDIGASLGVGASVGFEIDVGGMVETTVQAASDAWDTVKTGWDNFWSW